MSCDWEAVVLCNDFSLKDFFSYLKFKLHREGGTDSSVCWFSPTMTATAGGNGARRFFRMEGWQGPIPVGQPQLLSQAIIGHGTARTQTSNRCLHGMVVLLLQWLLPIMVLLKLSIYLCIVDGSMADYTFIRKYDCLICNFIYIFEIYLFEGVNGVKGERVMFHLPIHSPQGWARLEQERGWC